MCVCVCVCCILRPLFTSRVVIFYCHSLPRIRFSFFPHSISSFLFNLITVTHDWTISNGIMVIPRSYIFQLIASIQCVSREPSYFFRFWLFWEDVLFLMQIMCLTTKHGIIDSQMLRKCCEKRIIIIIIAIFIINVRRKQSMTRFQPLLNIEFSLFLLLQF